MIYKINMFLREWEGYDKVYSYLKENILQFLIIKAILYMTALIFCFIELNIASLSFRILIYLLLIFAEYFIGCIQKENKEMFLSFSSHFLMILDLLLVVLCVINLFIKI